MTDRKIKVGIIGAAGYTGGELLRLLVNHPSVEIAFAFSNSQKNKAVTIVHPDLIGETDLIFTDSIQTNVEAVFLGLPHGQTKAFLAQHKFSEDTVLIDLSTDYRDESEGFTYGLVEVNSIKISQSKKIANPGCFATAIQLALAPAIAGGLIKDSIHLSGITGSTGAGVKLSNTTHFSWRNQNVSTYKAFEHQHLTEVTQTFKQLNADFDQELLFMPYRGNFTRGIWITAYAPYTAALSEAENVYKSFYQDCAFVHLSPENIDLKQVVNTNKCIIHLAKIKGQLVVSCIIDNLLKGAAGQAIQNFNLIFKLAETSGLKLKSTAF